MAEIRGVSGGTQHTSDPVSVLVKSATPTPAAYILNTIGMMPQATGNDPLFDDINQMLNEQAQRDGGVLIICHDVQRPLDATAAFLDLDVIKDYMRNPGHSKFRVVVARTKADLWETIDYSRCKTFEDVHNKIFGSFEEKLPSSDMFLITGWRNEYPSDALNCQVKFQKTFTEVAQRIVQDSPNERNSPWLATLNGKLGTKLLIKHYHKLVSEQGRGFLQLVSDCWHLASQPYRSTCTSCSKTGRLSAKILCPA